MRCAALARGRVVAHSGALLRHVRDRAPCGAWTRQGAGHQIVNQVTETDLRPAAPAWCEQRDGCAAYPAISGGEDPATGSVEAVVNTGSNSSRTTTKSEPRRSSMNGRRVAWVAVPARLAMGGGCNHGAGRGRGGAAGTPRPAQLVGAGSGRLDCGPRWRLAENHRREGRARTHNVRSRSEAAGC